MKNRKGQNKKSPFFATWLANGKERRFMFKTLVASFLAIAILVIACAFTFYYIYQSSLVNELISSNSRILDRTDLMLSESYTQIENLALQLSLDTMRQISKTDESIVHDYYRLQLLTDSMVNLKNAHSYIHSCYMYFNQGNVIVTSFMGITSFSLFYDTSWYSYYRTHSNEISWMNCRKPYDSNYENQQNTLLRYYDDTNDVFTLLVPLPESLRSQGGVIIVNVYEDGLARLLSDGDSGGMCTYAVDKSGKVILAPMEGGKLYQSLDDNLQSIVCSAEEYDHVIRKNQGQDILYLFAPSRVQSNYIVMEIPLSNILEPTQELLFRTILISCFLLVAACIMMYFVFQHSLKPVTQLYRTISTNLAQRENGLPENADLQKELIRIIHDNKELNKLWENNRALIRHRTLSLLLQGHFVDNVDFQQRLDYMGIRFPYPLTTCILINLDVPRQSHTLLDDEYELIKMQIFQIIRDCIPQSIIGYTVDIDDLHIGTILNFEEERPGTILQFCHSIQHAASISEAMPYTLSFGIGKCGIGLNSLSAAFQGARSAAEYASSLGGNEIVSFSTISLETDTMSQTLPGNSIDQKVLSTLRLGNAKDADAALEEAFDDLQSYNAGLTDIKQFCIRLCSQIVSLLLENGVPADEAARMVDSSQFTDTSDVAQLRHCFSSMLQEICTQVLMRREHKKADTMDRIITFVQNSYMQDITVTQVADMVYMSVPYLCKVFKEYTNKTFTDYLTGIRVNASIDLLNRSNIKVMDIASTVGFSNVQSFIRAFKKYKNMTPSEYRETVIANNFQ